MVEKLFTGSPKYLRKSYGFNFSIYSHCIKVDNKHRFWLANLLVGQYQTHKILT